MNFFKKKNSIIKIVFVLCVSINQAIKQPSPKS